MSVDAFGADDAWRRRYFLGRRTGEDHSGRSQGIQLDAARYGGHVDVEGGELFGSRCEFGLASLSYRVARLSWCSMARLDTDFTVSDTGVRDASAADTVKVQGGSGSDTVSPCEYAVADTVRPGEGERCLGYHWPHIRGCSPLEGINHPSVGQF